MIASRKSAFSCQSNSAMVLSIALQKPLSRRRTVTKRDRNISVSFFFLRESPEVSFSCFPSFSGSPEFSFSFSISIKLCARLFFKRKKNREVARGLQRKKILGFLSVL